jgi:four helix bundle protein
MQDFHRLLVWERAHWFALDVRRSTRTFPRTGYSQLKSQLIRSAESIAYNIVEGCAAGTRREFARFLDISVKSTAEVEYQLQLAKDYGIMPPRTWQTLSAEVMEIRKMLCGLRRKLLTADRADRKGRPDSASEE